MSVITIGIRLLSDLCAHGKYARNFLIRVGNYSVLWSSPDDSLWGGRFA